MLAECEAKRRIVVDLETFRRAGESNAAEGMPAVLTMAGIIKGYERTVATLALPYADHPDYREEWKP